MKSTLKDIMRKEFAEALQSERGKEGLKKRELSIANVLYVFDQLIDSMDEEKASIILQKRVMDKLSNEEK